MKTNIDRREFLKLSACTAAAVFGFTHGWLQGFASRDANLDLLGESMPAGHGAVGRDSP